MDRDIVIGGIYRHYKSNEMIYQVIAEGIDSETLEKKIVYKSLYKHGNYDIGTVWIRPKDMFLSKLPEDKKEEFGQEYRFEYIGENE